MAESFRGGHLAGYRKPGSSGAGGYQEVIDDGTLCRSSSPSPGVAGHHSHLSRHARPPSHNKPHPRIATVKKIKVPSLHINSHGPDVEKLQRLLNSRLHSRHTLKVDGSFGLRTQEAVLHFQKKQRLVADGLVGPKTWFCLAAAPAAQIAAAQTAGVTVAAGPAFAGGPAAMRPSPVPSKQKPVTEWSLETRFEYVLLKTAQDLAPDVRDQFKGLVTGTGLAITVGTLVVWAAGHFFGVSEVTDAFLLGAGLVFIGWAAIDAARYFKNFLELTCTASSARELAEAASDLSKAIAIIGVVAFIALLAKVGRALGKGPKSPAEEVAPRAEAEPAPKPRPTPKETKVTEEPTKPKAPSKPPGVIDESEATFTPKERRIAETLKAEGKNVKAVPRSDTRTPDALVDGKAVEFKTMDPGATSSTVKNQVSKSIKRGGQARIMILDARDSGLTEAEAEKGLNRVAGIARGKIDSVRIIGNGYDVTRVY